AVGEAAGVLLARDRVGGEDGSPVCGIDLVAVAAHDDVVVAAREQATLLVAPKDGVGGDVLDLQLDPDVLHVLLDELLVQLARLVTGDRLEAEAGADAVLLPDAVGPALPA